jgi:hypothetical protein
MARSTRRGRVTPEDDSLSLPVAVEVEQFAGQTAAATERLAFKPTPLRPQPAKRRTP